ncbi:hypothetical protein NMY22_g9217 [Coprinellus aureogranulatus]|nr:hypothetical protein NMY22_g9217 [Coprinellus aureogranulatus]
MAYLAVVCHTRSTDSCPADPGSSGYSIVNNVRSLALRFGRIKSFKAYLSVSDHQLATPGGHPRALTLRSELQSSGVSITDVPHGKEAIGKMLIVDMLGCAFDRMPSEIVLVMISADHTLAYALSFLQMRSYQAVLVTPERSGNTALTMQAALCFNWMSGEGDANGLRELQSPPNRPHSQEGGRGRSMNEQRERLSTDYGTASSAAPLEDDVASSSRCTSTVKGVDLTDYLPEKAVTEEPAPVILTPPEEEKQLDLEGDNGEIVLSVPDSDEEEELAAVLSLSKAEQEAELLGQEEEEFQQALAQSLMDIGKSNNEDVDAQDATSSKVTLDTLPLPSAPPVQEAPSEEPPAYTARQDHLPDKSCVQPSELSPLSPPDSSSHATHLTSSDLSSMRARLPPDQDSLSATPLTYSSPASLAFTEPPVQTDLSLSLGTSFNKPLPKENYHGANTLEPSESQGGGDGHSVPSDAGGPSEHFGKRGFLRPFNILWDVMEEYRQQGVNSVSLTSLGEILPKRQPGVYLQAGVIYTADPLQAYVERAIYLGVLEKESADRVSLAKAYIPRTTTKGGPDPAAGPATTVPNSLPEASGAAPTSSPEPSKAVPHPPEGPSRTDPAPARKGVPPQFKTLVGVMKEYRDAGYPSVNRCLLGQILPQRPPNVYVLAGVASSAKPLKKYIEAAIEAGILVRDSDECVSLAKPKVPTLFATLVLIMQERHAQGMARVKRTALCDDLIKREPGIHIRAGFGNMTKPMKKYLDAAVEEGILVEAESANAYFLDDYYR